MRQEVIFLFFFQIQGVKTTAGYHFALQIGHKACWILVCGSGLHCLMHSSVKPTEGWYLVSFSNKFYPVRAC